MTFLGHVAISGLVMQFVPDPTLMVGINIGLHPVLDSIPHAEYHTFVHEHQSKRTAIIFTLIDLVLGVLYIALLWQKLPYSTAFIVMGLLAGLWADWFELLIGKVWPRFVYWHRYTHTWPLTPQEPIDWPQTVTGRTPTSVKLTIQSILVLIPLLFLLYR